MKASFTLLWLLLASPVHAAGEAVSERNQLSQRRGEIEARFARDSEACQQRFSVNDCLDGVRVQRLADLKPVQARIEVLDADARRERSRLQHERVAERQREAAIEEGKRVSKTLSTPSSAPASPASAPRTPRASTEAHAQSVRAQQAQAAQDARRNRDQSAVRQAEFEKRQRDQQQREQGRASQPRKPGINLPVPTAAEFASAAASAAASGAER